jgi:hypothetical protein
MLDHDMRYLRKILMPLLRAGYIPRGSFDNLEEEEPAAALKVKESDAPAAKPADIERQANALLGKMTKGPLVNHAKQSSKQFKKPKGRDSEGDDESSSQSDNSANEDLWEGLDSWSDEESVEAVPASVLPTKDSAEISELAEKREAIIAELKRRFPRHLGSISASEFSRWAQSTHRQAEGITLLNVVGAVYKVKDKKMGSEVLRITKEIVGDAGAGLTARRLGHPNFTQTILPCSISQLKCFFDEQKSQVMRADTGLPDKELLKRRTELLAYEKLLRNLVKSVLHNRADGRSFHISDFAVILVFHLHRWMRATLYNKWSLLTSNFDTQWEAYFRCFTFDHGAWRTGLLYQDAAELLGFRCPMPRCSLSGMCEEYCVSSTCKERGFSAITRNSAGDKRTYDKAAFNRDLTGFKNSPQGQAVVNPQATKPKEYGQAFWGEFNKRFPQYNKKSSTSDSSLSGEQWTREKAFTWLRDNQHLIASQRPLRGSDVSESWESGM